MTMRVRALLCLMVVSATIWLASCDHYNCGSGATFGNSSCSAASGGLGGGPGGGTTITAANATSLVYLLSGTSVDGAGFSGSTFANLAGYTAPTISAGFADNMTIVSKKFVYIPMGDTTVQGFSITRSTGALTPIPGSPFQTGGPGTADGAWSDPKGRFLFVGSEGTGNIWVFTINATTGALTEVSGSPFLTPSSADIMTVDASGKFLYVGQGFASSGVAAFTIDQTTGALTPILGSPFNLAIAQIRATPVGEYLLGVQQIQDNGSSATDLHVYIYAINPNTGIPTAVGGSPFATTGAPYDVTISPNGQFVYLPETAVGGTLSALEGFSLNQTTGAMAKLSGSPFSSLPIATQCQFEQAGTAMVCATSGASMSVLAASPSNGALTHAADLSVSPFAFAVTD